MDDLIRELQDKIAEAETVDSVLSIAVPYLDLPLETAVLKTMLANTRDRINRLGNRKGASLLCIDASGIFCTEFFKTQKWEDAVERLFKVAGEIPHDHLIVCDDSRKNFRREIYEGYKGSRKEKPEGFHEGKRSFIKQVMQSAPTIGVLGYESDDVMASASFRCKIRQHQCVIATEDKDLWQCLGGGTTCYSPIKKKYVSEQSLMEDQGITPKQVVDWLCLVGKDDTPSAFRIGPDTAKKVLQKYGSCVDIHDLEEFLSPKRAESITQFMASDYEVAKKLHQLVRTLEINW